MKQTNKHQVFEDKRGCRELWYEMRSAIELLRPILAAANVQVLSPPGWFYFLESQGVLNHAK